MPPLSDRDYTIACGRLASCLGVSLASARRKVDIRAVQEGLRAIDDKIALADRLLAEAEASGIDVPSMLSAQLGTVGNDDNFMVED
ncbi:MAG: hypothetical protein ACKOXO_04450 [Cyanobium sp.]